MALYSDGSARCWGSNHSAECTVPERLENWYAPGFANGITCATSIDLGAYGGVATYGDGSVRIWSSYPQLLQPTEDPLAPPGMPTLVLGLTNAKAVSAHAEIALAIREDDTAVWWGGFRYEPAVTVVHPTPVEGLPPVRDVALGSDAACAVTLDGEVWCWGLNAAGQLGDGTTIPRMEPRPVVGLAGATGVEAGAYFACALLEDGSVHCWGTHARGELGRGGEVDLSHQSEDYFFPTAAAVPGLPPVNQLKAGTSRTCVVANDGTVWCWGSNPKGEIAADAATTLTSATQVPGLTQATAVEIGAGHICALRSDGTVWCQGDSYSTGRSDGTGLPGPGLVPLDEAVDYAAQ
jgi:alpha-tubulin suppressor-like RCC1 family protein